VWLSDMHIALGFCMDHSRINFNIFVLVSFRKYYETKCLEELSDIEETSHQNTTESYKQEFHISGLNDILEKVHKISRKT
jgi:hypothetical protein